MEISREERGNIHDHPMSQQEKGEFYRTMRNVVVVVINNFQQRHGGDIQYAGGGIVVDKRGYILTAASLIPKKKEGISVLNVQILNGDLYQATPIDTNYNKGMSLLKLLNGPSNELNYAKFANETVHLGVQTFTIGHPNFLLYGFFEGQVCCECIDPMEITNSSIKCRSVNDLRKSTSDDSMIPRDLQGSLPLIQVSNVHGSAGIWGSPLFNSCGHVIGMHLLSFENFDYALHFQAVKNFIESVISREQPPSRGRQKMERGEGSRKRIYQQGH